MRATTRLPPRSHPDRDPARVVDADTAPGVVGVDHVVDVVVVVVVVDDDDDDGDNDHAVVVADVWAQVAFQQRGCDPGGAAKTQASAEVVSSGTTPP